MALVPIITIPPQQKARLIGLLSGFPKHARKAAMRATNKAMDKAFTLGKRIIAKDMGIKQADLTRPHRFGAVGRQSTGKALRKEPATESSLEARLVVSGKRIPVSFFKPKPTKLTEQKPIRVRHHATGKLFTAKHRGTGVAWRIGSRSNFSKDAFVGRARRGSAGSAAEGASGHIAVFRRAPGAKRLKIFELKGPSIPGFYEKSPEIRKSLEIDATQTFMTALDSQIRVLLDTGKLPGVA